MSSYTEIEILEKLKQAMSKPETLYQCKVVNYRGKDKKSQRKYSEIISERLLSELNTINNISALTREKSYKTESHNGKTLNTDSNRREERIALSMFGNEYSHIGKIIDYQIPLKNQQSDQAGKIDLLSVNAQNEIILVELKGTENKETLLRCVLEINTYWYLLNKTKLCLNFGYAENNKVTKAVLVYVYGAQRTEYENCPSLQDLMKKLDIQMYMYDTLNDAIENVYSVTSENIPTMTVLKDELRKEKGSFKKSITDHLESYKSQSPELANLPKGKYTFRKKSYEFNHILPRNERSKNFITSYRKSFIESKYYKKNSMHIFSHHLNSSQAMCINFFFPLVCEEQLFLITDILGFPTEKIPYNKAEFEKAGKEPEGSTSFDFYFETESGKKFYFEIKYTEGEFGKADNDSRHTAKFEKVYQHMLEPLTEEYQTKSKFLQNYQILRNLIHIDKDSYVIFLYPDGNKKIKKQAEAAKMEMLAVDFKDHFFPITWEALFEKVTRSHIKEKLKDQYGEFSKKYFLEQI